jgi:hypothetical protein
LALGKVEIKWTNYFGEPGSIVYGPLLYMAERGSELEVLVTNPPEKLTVEEPVWIECSLANRSNRPVNISLASDPALSNIAIHGLSIFNLGDINPNYQIKFNILIFPQFPGVQRLGGISAFDSL